MTDKVRRHPNSGELYTPVNTFFYDWLHLVWLEHEKNWRIVAWKTDLRLKQLRNLRQGKRKAVSMRVMDRMITTSGVGKLSDFTFFTASDLVALGVWKEVHYVEGNKRIQAGIVTVAPVMTRLEKERAGRKKQRERQARERREKKRKGEIW